MTLPAERDGEGSGAMTIQIVIGIFQFGYMN